MSLTIGTRIGSFEVLGSLGAGGMGEVYRARDSKLKREVALKVLPADVANDRERLARFQREAEVLASLNHPHIAHVYGIEDNALVMELVEGEDLAERLRRGPIPIDEALPIAKQIAEALEAAHDAGVVHRDLKPANVKVRPDGTVKVLDFGLAKALDQDLRSSSPRAADNSPTITSPAMTMRGVILGTAAYMSPEQAKGKAVDKRADIWAFGVVLFEMLTGTRAFTGANTSELIASVLRDTPPLDALPAAAPAAIRRLLRRCLAKDPKQRLADASTVRLEIDEALASGGESVATAIAPRTRERVAWSLTAAMALVTAAVIGLPFLRPAPAAVPTPPEVKFNIAGATSNGVVSADGRRIAYRASLGADVTLVVQDLSTGTTRTLAAAGDPGVGSLAGSHFWSPDGASIGFFAGQKLRRIDVQSGTVQTLADAPTPRGGAWGPDGTILFAPAGNSALYRLPSGGGVPAPATELNPLEASHRDPQFLPDGRRFIYWVLGPAAVRGVYLASLDDGNGARVVEADGPASFAAPDHILFVREGVLYEQRLDLATARLIGEPMMVAAGVPASPTTGRQVSASETGVLTYRQEVEDPRQLQWVDRTGQLIGKVGEPRHGITAGKVSPDGGTIALGITRNGHNELWLMEPTRGTSTRFALDGNQPAWSPDGTKIAFTSGQDGLIQMYARGVGVNESAWAVFKSSESQNVGDWSPDGRHLLFTSQSPTNARDLWVVTIAGADRRAARFVESPAEETGGRFSPDGQWVAYASDETGNSEVYIRPFPGPGRAWRVSTKGGGGAAFWRRDGKELYYVSGQQIMAVAIDTSPATPSIGAPQPLFRLRGTLIAAPDGRRFLVAASVAEVPAAPLTVIVNWAARTR